jgi:two-component system LytT family response regulator
MTRAIIIEDEKRASDYLENILTQVDETVLVEAVLPTVEKSIRYLSEEKKIDIIFCDVQLPDGLSFAIFNEININVPIIFITGYDKFMMDAFENNGIDYLLKPISKEDVDKALSKYKALKKHFSNANEEGLQHLLQYVSANRKTRIIARKGMENITLLLNDVVLFYTENKVVHAIDKIGKKYLVDKNLTDLEAELDSKIFFRANRQYIVNIDYIKSFRSYERVKLWVELTLGNIEHTIIISQETAPHFKKWLLDA